MKPKILSYIAKAIISTYFFSVREKINIHKDAEKLLAQGHGFILAAWHNQILSLTCHVSKYVQKKRKVKTAPLVSLSKDGELIYETFLRYGLVAVRGSTSRGAAAGLKAILKTVKDNKVPLFSPDGPRGPVYKLQPGVVQVASMCKLPIVHFYSQFDRFYEFKSWDKHRFPRFGARQWIDYDEPFYVPEGIQDIEEVALMLENKMKSQMERVNALVSIQGT